MLFDPVIRPMNLKFGGSSIVTPMTYLQPAA
jgi:hypothetical protein